MAKQQEGEVNWSHLAADEDTSPEDDCPLNSHSPFRNQAMAIIPEWAVTGEVR